MIIEFIKCVLFLINILISLTLGYYILRFLLKRMNLSERYLISFGGAFIISYMAFSSSIIESIFSGHWDIMKILEFTIIPFAISFLIGYVSYPISIYFKNALDEIRDGK
jgi:hypothetical protein